MKEPEKKPLNDSTNNLIIASPFQKNIQLILKFILVFNSSKTLERVQYTTPQLTIPDKIAQNTKKFVIIKLSGTKVELTIMRHGQGSRYLVLKFDD